MANPLLPLLSRFGPATWRVKRRQAAPASSPIHAYVAQKVADRSAESLAGLGGLPYGLRTQGPANSLGAATETKPAYSPALEHVSPTALGTAFAPPVVQQPPQVKYGILEHAGPSAIGETVLHTQPAWQIANAQAISQKASRLADIHQEMSSIAVGPGTWKGLQFTPGTQSPQYLNLQEEAASIIRSVGGKAPIESAIVPGPDGQPIPIEYKWKTSDLFNTTTRISKAAWETMREKSPTLDLIGRGIAVMASAPGTTAGLVWSRLTSPFTFIKQGFRLASDPNADTSASVANLVRYGWNEQDARKEVHDLQQGQGRSLAAWNIVDLGNRLAPFGEKVGLLDEQWKTWLASGPRTPEELRAFEHTQSLQGLRERVQNNLVLGQEYDQLHQSSVAEIQLAKSLVMSDPTGLEVQKHINLGIDLERQAQAKLEARDDIPTYSYRYTWSLDDHGKELEAKAKEAIVLATVQLGHPLEPWQVEETTNRFTNPIAEMGGDMVFDPINLIGFLPVEKLIAPLGGVLGDIWKVAVTEIKPLRVAVEWITAESIAAGATKMGHYVSRVLGSIGRASEDPNQLSRGLEIALDAISNPATHSPEELARLGVRPWHLDLLSEAITALRGTGAKALDEPAARKKLLQVVGQAVEEALASKQEAILKAGGNVAEAVLHPSDVLQVIPNRIENALLDGSRLWRGGPVKEGAIAWFAKKVGLEESATGALGIDRKLIESALRLQRTAWSIHVKLLLTARPGFFVWNNLDTMFRAMVGGAMPWDNVVALTKDMPGGFVDELVDSFFTKGGGDLLDPQSVRRLLSGEYDPKYGIFSVFWDAAKKAGDPIRGALEGMSTLHSVMEASYRTRLYSQHIYRELAVARSLIAARRTEVFAANGIEGPLRAAIEELDLIHEYNGSKFLQAVEELVTGKRGVASAVIPPDLLSNAVSVMGETQGRRFVRDMATGLRGLIDEGLTDAKIDTYFDGIARQVADEATRMREAADTAKASIGDLNKDTHFDPPDLPAKPGAAPSVLPEAEAVRPAVAPEISQAGDEAIGDINRQLKGQQPLTADQEVAVRNLAGMAGQYEASARRELAELAGVARVESLKALEVEAANPEIVKGSQYVEETVSATQRFLSGPARSFMLEGPLGPKNAGPGIVVKRWTEYYSAHGKMYTALAEQSRGVSQLVRDGNWTELARRLDAKEFPTLADLWRASGWDLQIEDGVLKGIKTPFYFGNYYNDEEWVLQEFLRRNGAKDWESLSALELEQPYATQAMLAHGEPTAAVMDRAALDAEYSGLANRAIELAQGPTAGSPEAVAELTVARARMAEIDNQLRPVTSVVKEVAAAGEAAQSVAEAAPQIDEEVATAWRAVQSEPRPGGRIGLGYSKARTTDGRPALESFETFEAYLKGKIDDAVQAGDTARAETLRARLQSVRQSYRQTLISRGRLDVAEAMLPPVHMLDQGTQTWMHMAGDAETAQEHLDNLVRDYRAWVKDAHATGSWRVRPYSAEEAKRAMPAAQELALLKDKGIYVAQYGSDAVAGKQGWDAGGTFLGQKFRGALSLTNKAMIDYSTNPRGLRYLRSIFPFVRFQIKSFPFWLETMTVHPELAAFYMKYLQTTRRFAYQRGAIDLAGNARPSMVGKVPIPGTDIWVNPLGPFSFRYPLEFLFPQDTFRDETKHEDMGLMESIVNFLGQTGQLFGVGMHPWLAALAYETGALSPTKVPRQGLYPQSKLIPPFAMRAIMSSLRKSRFGGAVADMIDPETTFSDYMIYKRVLVNANAAMGDPNMSMDEKRKLAATAAAALDINQRQDADGKPLNQAAYDMWVEARNQLDNDEWYLGMLGYFSGIYGKAYTDKDAELERVRREMNALKLSMNNEIAAKVFNYDADAERRWQHYLDERYQTPEGYVYGLRNLIGWAISPEGKQLYGEDYIKLVSNRIHQDAAINGFYDGMGSAKEKLSQDLAAYPIGSKLRGVAYDEYAATTGGLFTDEVKTLLLQTNNTVGYKPKRLVYEHAREQWFETIRNTAPVQGEGEEYSAWRARYDAWVQNIKYMIPGMIKQFQSSFANVELADPNQRPEDMVLRLATETNPAGYEAWQKENDSIFTALDRVYRINYLDKYWEAIGNKKHEDRQLADRQFYSQWPDNDGTPSEDQYLKWIDQEYPGRFTKDEILRGLRGRGENTPQERSLEGANPLKVKMNDAFDILDLVAPGREYGKFLDAYVAAGGDEGDLSVLYNPVTGQASRDLTAISDKSEAWITDVTAKLKRAAAIIGLDKLTNDQLAERGDARGLNDTFRANVEKALGADFWTTLSVYSRMSRSEKAIFKKENPEDYARVNSYYDMRDAYAEQQPLWAQYYVGEPTKKTAAGGRGGGGGRRGAGGGGAGRTARLATPPQAIATPGLRSTLVASELLKPGQLGRGGTTRGLIWPRWLLEKVGEVAAEEVKNLVSSGQPIDPRTEAFLTNIAATNKDAEPIITSTLGLNNKAKAIAQMGRGSLYASPAGRKNP